MIGNFYVYMRHGFGLSKAWRFAFGRTLKDTLLYTIYWMLIWVLLGAILGLLIGKINEREQRAANSHKAYVQSMEQILAQCLSDSTGKPITIEGKTYLCGIYSVGL